ncbi:MAG: alpha/beta hydrolase [Spirochaetes bacterium]|nr:alpha/beta hydrolase [Spirochaetota bacterium]
MPRIIPYKICDEQTLSLHLFQPELKKKCTPVIVFFHGGGWGSGAPDVHYYNCAHFASRGWTAISVQYRLKNPIKAVADAKSAVRWIRIHSTELSIDPERLVVGGSSAGGHLAACTQLAVTGDDSLDDLSIPVTAAACILLSPVLDTGTTGFGNNMFAGRGEEFSPLHLVRPGLPPMLVMHGTADDTIPFAQAQSFHDAMISSGNRCELRPYPGGDHIFWRKDAQTQSAILGEIEQFLYPILARDITRNPKE